VIVSSRLKEFFMNRYEQNIARLIRIASAAAVMILGLGVSPGLVTAISARAGVEFPVSVLWAMIGPLLAVSNRLRALRAARDPFGPAMSRL
jgi:hypothetical protein